MQEILASTPVALNHDDQLAAAPMRPRSLSERSRQVPQRAVSDPGLKAPCSRIAAVAVGHEAVRLPAVIAMQCDVCAGAAPPLAEDRNGGRGTERHREQQ